MTTLEPRASSQVGRAHYSGGYDSFARFASYWHQIEEASAMGGRIVEIGIGNGTVSAVLRARGFDITTVDIDEDLAPDVVADVRALPFPSESFETALAAEVLEHIPWEDVPAAVGELARVANRGVVTSVPNSQVAFTLDARIPNALHLVRMAVRRRLRLRQAVWALSQRGSWRRTGDRIRELAEIERVHTDAPPKCDQHFWELGVRGVGREDFIRVLESCNLHLVRDFRAPAFPYHHFFVLAAAGSRAQPTA